MRSILVRVAAGVVGLAGLAACQLDPDGTPVTLESEPNNSAATADEIPVEITVKGLLLPGDVDVFRLPQQGAVRLSCSISHPEVWGDFGMGVEHFGTCDDDLLVGGDTLTIELRGVGAYLLHSTSA